MATLTGTAGRFVPFALEASAGAFTSPPTGELQIGPGGTATFQPGQIAIYTFGSTILTVTSLIVYGK